MSHNLRHYSQERAMTVYLSTEFVSASAFLNGIDYDITDVHRYRTIPGVTKTLV